MTSTEGAPSLQKRRAHTNTNEQLLVAVYYWLRNQPRVEYCQEGTGRNQGLSEEIPPFTDVSERSLSIFFRDCLGSYLQGLLALRVVMWAAIESTMRCVLWRGTTYHNLTRLYKDNLTRTYEEP